MIDKSKTYRTRDGREVRIYATDGGMPNSVHGAILTDGKWRVNCWKSDGSWETPPFDIDLIEVRPRHKRTVWLNVYDECSIAVAWPSKEDANGPQGDRIACIKVDLDFEEGEGL